MNCHWILNGEIFTSPSIDMKLRDKAPRNWAYWCSFCGDVWARIYFNDTPHINVKEFNCIKHGGGLLNINDRAQFFLSTLNNVLLKREFLILYELKNRSDWQSQYEINLHYN